MLLSEHKMGHHHNPHHHHHHHHHHQHLMQVSPRISFSNDFVDAQQAMRQELARATARSAGGETASSDFEFSVTNYSMMSADELFFKGRLLPFKDTAAGKDGTASSSSSQRVTTLRDELLQGGDDVTFRPAKGSSSMRWRSLLGLKRAHGGSHSKKAEKAMLHEEAHVSKTSQDLLNEELEINGIHNGN